MGLGTNIIVFAICLGFAASLIAVGSVKNDGLTQNYGNLTYSFISQAGLGSANSTTTGGLLLLAGAAIAVASNIVFPNPYTLFGGFAIFLFGFYNVLSGIFSAIALGDQISQFLSILISLLFTIAVIIWYKGTGEF